VLKLVPLLSKLLLQKLNTNMKWDNTIHPLRKETFMGGGEKRKKEEKGSKTTTNHTAHC